MALLNQLPLTTKSGIPVPAGSVISFRTEFNPRSTTMDIALFIWYSQADYGNMSTSALAEPCIQVKEYTFAKTLTEQDFDSLSPLAVHQYIMAYIEAWAPEWVGKLSII